MTVATDRLLLRQWCDGDYEPFARLTSDPVVMEYFPKRLSRQESDELATRIRTRIEENGWGLWAVEVTGVVPFIGFVGLNRPDERIPIMPCVEIGWRLAREFWGKGYASEAAQAALAVGFEQLGLDEIVSFTATTNVRSQRVMQRIGMRHEGETFDHPLVPAATPLRKHVIYRLTRAEWQVE
jgi:RimJ/RimL family protein N-acetyltransferase